MAACFVSTHSIMDTPHFSGETVHGARNRNEPESKQSTGKSKEQENRKMRIQSQMESFKGGTAPQAFITSFLLPSRASLSFQSFSVCLLFPFPLSLIIPN